MISALLPRVNVHPAGKKAGRHALLLNEADLGHPLIEKLGIGPLLSIIDDLWRRCSLPALWGVSSGTPNDTQTLFGSNSPVLLLTGTRLALLLAALCFYALITSKKQRHLESIAAGGRSTTIYLRGNALTWGNPFLTCLTGGFCISSNCELNAA